jgi:hypothetical protein
MLLSIDSKKIEEVFRNLGVVFISSGAIGFFFKFSLFGSISAVIIGIIFILFGVKENSRDRN